MPRQPLRVAINGFGRIGRVFTRIAWGHPAIEIVAINSRSDADIYAHLLKYDSVYGVWDHEVGNSDNDAITIDGVRVPLHHEDEVTHAPWANHAVDVVLESSGVFRDRASSEEHLRSGAKTVLITAPAKNEDKTLIYAINHQEFDPAEHRIISAASCTTTALAPLAAILHQAFGVKHGTILTTHAYTNDQHLVDAPHRSNDFRRCRAASLSIIPTSTGAAKTIGRVIPALEGKLDGLALRVPVSVPSVLNFVAEVNAATTVEAVNDACRSAARASYAKSFQVSDAPLVSVDFVRSPYGGVLDALSTQVVDNHLVSLLAWYDNEWGYVNQVVNLVEYMALRMK